MQGSDVTVIVGIIAIVGFVIGRLSAVFGVGKRIGKAEAHFNTVADTVNKHSDSIRELDNKIYDENKKLDTKIDLLEKHHESDVREIQKFFATSAGGQKFMTFPDHDSICLRNTKPLVDAISSFTEAVKENSKQFIKMSENFHILSVEVAILKERRDSGIRQDNPKENGFK
jgi:hypothetical protein